MYLGSDNYLGPTAYLGDDDGPIPEPTDAETLIQWRDITLHGLIGRFTISELAGWDDLPDSRQQWDARPNQHGTFDAPVYASERHIMLAGACFDREQRDALMREMKKAMTYGPYAEEFTVTHAGLRLSAAARLVRFNATYINWGTGAWGWQAEWVAPDPFRYGRQRMVYTGLPELKGGLAFPLFTDGTQSGTAYAWTGTPGASTSTMSVDGVVVRENLLLDPGASNLSSWEAHSAMALSLTDGWGEHASAVRATRLSDGPTRVSAFAALETSATYTVRLQVRLSAPLTVTVRLRPNVTVSTGESDLGAVSLPAGESTITLTGATTATAWTAAGGVVLIPGGATGDTIDITGGQVEAGPTVGPYFDGDTPDETVFGGGGWLDFGEAGSSGRITLSNDGDADAWPTLAVRGPAPEGFTITNIETGNRIVSRTVIPAGSTLTIHTAKGTAYLDGADRSGQLTVREWTAVPPGESYTFQFTAPTFTSAALVASARDTYA